MKRFLLICLLAAAFLAAQTVPAPKREIGTEGGSGESSGQAGEGRRLTLRSRRRWASTPVTARLPLANLPIRSARVRFAQPSHLSGTPIGMSRQC